MKKCIIGLIIVCISILTLNASEQETFKIFACLADPVSRDCSGILFDNSDERIDGQNLTLQARKNLSTFFQKANLVELDTCEKKLEQEYGFSGKISFSVSLRMARLYEHHNKLDDLTALVLYRYNNHWMFHHEAESDL